MKKYKLEENDPPVIMSCQLKAVSIATTYHELVGVYVASRRCFGKTLPLFIIISAIRDRQAQFGDYQGIANADK